MNSLYFHTGENFLTYLFSTKFGNIGSKPKEVDVKCYSPNWNGIKCSFEQSFNPIYINYTMYYKMDTQPKFIAGQYTCKQDRENRTEICEIEANADAWRASYPYLFVLLELENALGKTVQKMTFNTTDIGRFRMMCISVRSFFF